MYPDQQLLTPQLVPLTDLATSVHAWMNIKEEARALGYFNQFSRKNYFAAGTAVCSTLIYSRLVVRCVSLIWTCALRRFRIP